MLSTLYIFIYLIFTTTLSRSYYYYLYFIDGQTGVQAGEVIHPGSHCK